MSTAKVKGRTLASRFRRSEDYWKPSPPNQSWRKGRPRKSTATKKFDPFKSKRKAKNQTLYTDDKLIAELNEGEYFVYLDNKPLIGKLMNAYVITNMEEVGKSEFKQVSLSNKIQTRFKELQENFATMEPEDIKEYTAETRRLQRALMRLPVIPFKLKPVKLRVMEVEKDGDTFLCSCKEYNSTRLTKYQRKKQQKQGAVN